MKEIKTKEFVDAQEVFEGVAEPVDRVRRGLGRGSDYARNLADDGQVSSDEYAADQLQYAAEDIGYEAGHIAVDTTRSITKHTCKAIHRIREHRRERDRDPEEPVTQDPAPEAFESSPEEPSASSDQRHPVHSTDLDTLPECTSVNHPHGKIDEPNPSARSLSKPPDTPTRSAKAPQKIPDAPKGAQPTQRSHITVRQTTQSVRKATVKNAQNTVKQSQQAAKASREATQASIKTAQASSRAAQQAARAAAEASRKVAELLREAAKAAAEAAKVAAKAIAAAAKATAAAIEEFIGFLASGGWVALLIIAVIIIILVIIIAVIGYLDPSIALPE